MESSRAHKLLALCPLSLASREAPRLSQLENCCHLTSGKRHRALSSVLTTRLCNGAERRLRRGVRGIAMVMRRRTSLFYNVEGVLLLVAFFIPETVFRFTAIRPAGGRARSTRGEVWLPLEGTPTRYRVHSSVLVGTVHCTHYSTQLRFLQFLNFTFQARPSVKLPVPQVFMHTIETTTY